MANSKQDGKSDGIIRNPDGTFVKGAPSPNPKGRREGSINKKQAVSAILKKGFKEFLETSMLSKQEISQLSAQFPEITNGQNIDSAIFNGLVERQIVKALGENDTAAFSKVMELLGKDVDITSNGETINTPPSEEDRHREVMARLDHYLKNR